jgi:hypothetical protein
VQEHRVAGVDVTLERLHPVAFLPVDLDAALWHYVGLEVRQRLRRGARTEIGPHEPATLDARLRARGLLLEVALGGLARHVHSSAGHVELPAVVHAPQPLVLVAPAEQAGAAVRAVVLDQADGADVVRKAMRFSPSRRMRTGRPRACAARSTGSAASSTSAIPGHRGPATAWETPSAEPINFHPPDVILVGRHSAPDSPVFLNSLLTRRSCRPQRMASCLLRRSPWPGHPAGSTSSIGDEARATFQGL